jgi:hypothetical protein
LFRDSKFFRKQRDVIQMKMGADEVEGPKLLALCNSLQYDARVAAEEVADDDLESQTRQQESIINLGANFTKYHSNHKMYLESFRPGALAKPAEIYILPALKIYYEQLDCADSANAVAVKMIKGIALAFGQKEFAQMVSEKLLRLSSDSAQLQLNTALALDMDDMAHAKQLLGAYRASKQILSTEQCNELHEKMSVAMNLIVDVVGSEGAVSAILDEVAVGQELLTALAADPKIFPAGGDNDEAMVNNVAIFNGVVDKVKNFKRELQDVHLSLTGGDHIAISTSCAKLLTSTSHLQALGASKKPTWSGSASTMGEVLLASIGVFLPQGIAILDAHGRGKFSAALAAGAQTLEGLQKWANGRPTDPDVLWSEGFSADASKETILEAFNTHLKDIDGDKIFEAREHMIMVPRLDNDIVWLFVFSFC